MTGHRTCRTLLIAAFCAALMLFPTLPVPSAEKTTVILVYPFENLGQAEHSWLARGIADTMANDLQLVKGFVIITEQERRAAMREIELAQAGLTDEEKLKNAGFLLGADRILAGSYQVQGGRVRVIAKLVEVPSGVIGRTVKADGKLDDIFSLEDRVISELFDELIDRQAKKEIERLPTDKTGAYRWYSMGLEAMYKNPNRSLYCFQKAIAIDPLYVDALLQAGQLAANTMNRFALGEEYAKKSLDAAVSRYGKKSLKYAVVLIVAGNINLAMDRLSRAGRQYRDAMKLMETIERQDSRVYGSALENLGLVYMEMERYRQAGIYYRRALERSRKHGRRASPGYINFLRNIGVLYIHLDQPDKSLEVLSEAKKLADRLGLQQTKLYGGILANTAIVYKNQKRYDEALPLYRQALSILERHGLTRTKEYAGTLFNMGLVYYHKGDIAASRKYVRMSHRLYTELGLPRWAKHVQSFYDIHLR